MIMDLGMLFNTLEEEDTAYGQSCAYGFRCGGHAVYCNNNEWKDAPRKCRRNWYTGGDIRDEDCPGYLRNDNYIEEE